MSAARRRLGNGPAPAAPATPAAPRRLTAERAVADQHHDGNREQPQAGRDRRAPGTGAPTPPDVTPRFYFGGKQSGGRHP